jgi:hypothetical protein
MSEHLNEYGSYNYNKEIEALAEYISRQGAFGALDLFTHPDTNALDRVFIRDAAKRVVWSVIPEKGNYQINKPLVDLLETIDMMDAYIDAEITAGLENVSQSSMERLRTEPIPVQQSELERAA